MFFELFSTSCLPAVIHPSCSRGFSPVWDTDGRLSISPSQRYSEALTLWSRMPSTPKSNISTSQTATEIEACHDNEIGTEILEDIGIGPAPRDDRVVPH